MWKQTSWTLHVLLTYPYSWGQWFASSQKLLNLLLSIPAQLSWHFRITGLHFSSFQKSTLAQVCLLKLILLLMSHCSLSIFSLKFLFHEKLVRIWVFGNGFPMVLAGHSSWLKINCHSTENSINGQKKKSSLSWFNQEWD